MTEITDILDSGEVIDYGSSLIGVQQHPLATGIPTWDEACDETGGRGLGDWWYTVIGGASNAGKTQLMMYLARQAAEQGLMPGIVTMETPKRGLQRQMYSNLSSFNYFDLLPHRWETGDPKAKVERLSADIAAYRDVDRPGRSLLVADYNRSPTLADIMASLEVMYEAGSRCVFVDHLQLIKAPADQIADRATEISEELRQFAHDRGCLVIALSQLNRWAARQRDRCPTMHDLWGGTSIESNANMVMLIDHSQQERDPKYPHLLRTWLVLDKNREGPAKIRIPVEINFKSGVWREALPNEVDLWPDSQPRIKRAS